WGASFGHVTNLLIVHNSSGGNLPLGRKPQAHNFHPDNPTPNCYPVASMKQWISDYIRAQKAAHDSISVEGVAALLEHLRAALREGRHIFVFGNGGSAA